jgi:hypothetical protein
MTEPLHVAVGGTDVKVFADPYVSPTGLSGDLVLRRQGIGLDGVRLRDAGGFWAAHRANETLRARLGPPVAENRYQEANRS